MWMSKGYFLLNKSRLSLEFCPNSVLIQCLHQAFQLWRGDRIEITVFCQNVITKRFWKNKRGSFVCQVKICSNKELQAYLTGLYFCAATFSWEYTFEENWLKLWSLMVVKSRPALQFYYNFCFESTTLLRVLTFKGFDCYRKFWLLISHFTDATCSYLNLYINSFICLATWEQGNKL